jgi:hypothetical protein
MVLVQAILLLKVSTRDIEDRLRKTPGVGKPFRPGSPWKLGVLIEADSTPRLLSIANQLRSSLDIGQSDLFMGPGKEGRKPTASPPLEITRLFQDAAKSLQEKRVGTPRGRSFLAPSELPSEPPSEGSRLADDALQLDFSKIVDALRSYESTAALRRAPGDSDKNLLLKLREVFLNLSRDYEGSPMAKEALEEIAAEFEGLVGASQETYMPRLRQLTEELGRLVEVRNAYAENARGAGFERDFVSGIRGKRTGDE